MLVAAREASETQRRAKQQWSSGMVDEPQALDWPGQPTPQLAGASFPHMIGWSALASGRLLGVSVLKYRALRPSFSGQVNHLHTFRPPLWASKVINAMADPISLSSGLVALVTFALQSSLALYNTVDSFRNHQRTARELREELEALNVVLQSLLETVTNDEKFDIPALRLPLERCGMACKGFEEKIARCTPRSNRSRTSFRDWMKLTYMGGDITEFRNMLAGYKSTINIALAAANL